MLPAKQESDYTEGAGDGLEFKSWDDFKGYIQDVGISSRLTNAEKIKRMQEGPMMELQIKLISIFRSAMSM